MTISSRSRSSAVALACLSLALSGPPPAIGRSASPSLAPQKAEPAPPAQLSALLDKAAAYCRRLENSAFDFVCREVISETVNPSLDADKKAPLVDPGWKSPKPTAGTPFPVSKVRKTKRSFVYDYQCVRAGRTIREIRTQLEENGKKRVVPNAELKTSVVVFGTALLGPVGLFGERFQAGYDFSIAGEDTIGKKKVIIIDARPKPGAPPTRNLYGKAWLDPANGDILKIEWSESRVGRFDIFERRGQLYDRKPRLVISSEFSAEKNGIRFPSLLSVEEAYLDEAGRAAVRSTTEVVYKDFKFFTVEVQIHD
jgi:hypothetical protein